MRLPPLATTAGFIAHASPTLAHHLCGSLVSKRHCFSRLNMSQQALGAAGPSPTWSGGYLTLGLDPFCFRQFDDPQYPGTRIPMEKPKFMEQPAAGLGCELRVLKLHELLRREQPPLVAGYAPFCKHIFVENFTDAKVSCLKITEDNKKLIQSGYAARRPEELAVLTRWLPLSLVQDQIRRAKYLDLILYSREQIAKEAASMAKADKVIIAPPLGLSVADPAAPEWSIISIKAQDEPFELPMNPITMMRNALIEEGGSGVAIDRTAYARSVEYWSKHIIVQDDA